MAHRMLWKMGIPMALELVSTKCLCLPSHALITTNFQGQLPRDSELYLLPTLSICFIPCTDLLMQEKSTGISEPCQTSSDIPFLFLTLFTGSQHFVLLNPQAGRSGCWLFILLSLGPKFLTLEDLGAGSS